MIEILEVNNVNTAINTVTYGTDKINSECYHHNSILVIIMHIIIFFYVKNYSFLSISDRKM